MSLLPSRRRGGARVGALAAALLLLVAAPAPAAGGLVVLPTRAVFEGRTRSTAISLTNQGAAATTYRISLVRRRMTAAGAFVPVETPLPGERFADDLVRYSPRQVTLPPGGSQVVRLQVRKPADLAAGEYRSHLLLREVPTARAGEPEDGGTFGVRLDPNYGITIPVIVRHGTLTCQATLRDLALGQPAAASKGPSLTLTLGRAGERSLFGDVVAEHVPPGGAPSEVAVIRGLAVYVPNAARQVRLALPPGLRGGRLRVRFAEPAVAEGAARAEADIALP